MKKSIIYLWIVIAGISLNGCYDLDTYPGDTLSESVFWKTEDHVKQALMGVYDAMRADQAFGLYFVLDHLGEIGYGYDVYPEFPRGTYTARSGSVEGKWSALYEGVQRANGFISRVSDLSFLNEETKAEYIAEGKFLRAVFYFELLKFYGGVPYYDESTNVNADYADMKKPRNTADEIRSYIISDLNDAVAKLKPVQNASEYGRATKGAAYALRGKVYLYNKEWNNAVSDFEEVAYNKSNNYGYGLDSDYATIFKLYNGAKSPEMIFAVQNKGGVGNSYGMKLNFYMGTRNSYGSCWNNTVPSTELVDMYECPDGKPFNWDDIFPGYNAASAEARQNLLCVEYKGGEITSLLNADTAKILNAYKNRDSRLMATAIVPYSTYKGWYSNAPKDMLFILEAAGSDAPNESGGTMRNNNGSWRTYFYRKFVTEYDLDGAISDRSHTPFEFPLIRYADVLLMLAEAYNESGQLDKAVIELNKVRARESVHLPGLNSGPAWLAVTTKDQMTERIRKERAVELAGEGHRFNDLRRWGVAREVLNKNAVSIYGGFLYGQVFTDRDMLWPIPAVEIERNPVIEPNPGW
jgi:hypothetical protein